MKERVLAIIGAIALVAVALVARGFLADDDGGGGKGGGGARPVVACTADLMAICDALAQDGKIADDPPTLDLGKAAASGRVDDQELDGWITWDGAPGVANLDADDAGREPAWGEASAVATSPLAIVTPGGVTLPDGCSFNALTWSCLLDAADAGLPVGVGTGRTAESLTRLYPMALTLVGEDDFRSIDGARIRSVIESPQERADRGAYVDQVRTMRTKKGALDLVVAPLGLLQAQALTPFSVTPEATMTAVVAGRPADDLDLTNALASARVTAAIKKLGLTVDPGADLATDERAGELYALREKVGS